VAETKRRGAAVKFLFVTWAGGGNSTPVIGLATRLIRRGHDVQVVSPDDSRPRFAEVSVPYDVMPRQPGAVLRAIERSGPDVVVVDFMMPSWLSQAEASGVPTVALVHTLYDRIAAGLLLAFTTLDAVNDERIDLGLDPVADASALLDRMDRALVTAYADLEGSPIPEGANVRHVGAILEEAGPDAGWEPPATPLVLVSLGTTPGLGDDAVLPRLFDAVTDLPVHVLVNAGTHVDTSAFEPPGNVTVTGYVRHAAVMPHVDAVVTHGGLGVTLAALSHGRPMVALPLGRDQPHNAARIDAVGAGIALDSSASADEIRDAITLVLDDASYRSRAQRFAAEYAPAASVALDELETVAKG